MRRLEGTRLHLSIDDKIVSSDYTTTYPIDWTPTSSLDNGWPLRTSELRDPTLVLEVTDPTGLSWSSTRTITLGCDLI